MALPSLLAQPASLWTLIDDYLVDLVTDWKGLWLETSTARIEVAETYNPDSVGLPFILIVGYERKFADAEAPFGDGEYHISGITYPYEIYVSAAFMTIADAKDFAAKVSESLSDAVRAVPDLDGLIADNGEHVQYIDFDDGDLYVRGLAGQEPEGRYTGTACVRLIINTEV